MRKHLAMLVVAVMGAGTLAACGGDDSTGLAKTTTTTAAKASGGSETTDVTTGNADFDALIAKAKSASYRITYKNTATTGTFTISQQPPKKAFLTNDGTRLISDGTNFTSCTGTGSSAPCVTLPAAAGAGVDALVQGYFGATAAFLLSSSQGTDGIVFDTSKSTNETIAGRDAKCAEVTGGALVGGGGKFKVCIDKEFGVMLLTETSGNGTTNRIEATEVGDPQASDFATPN